jgi:hypothetical protein
MTDKEKGSAESVEYKHPCGQEQNHCQKGCSTQSTSQTCAEGGRKNGLGTEKEVSFEALKLFLHQTS